MTAAAVLITGSLPRVCSNRSCRAKRASRRLIENDSLDGVGQSGALAISASSYSAAIHFCLRPKAAKHPAFTDRGASPDADESRIIQGDS